MSAQTRCPNCGALNPETAEWCGQCMQALGPAVTPGLPPSPRPPAPASQSTSDHGWVRLVYLYLAALFGLVVAVIALIFVIQFMMGGAGEAAGRAAMVVVVGAAVWFVHLSTASNQSHTTSGATKSPATLSTGGTTHWSHLVYLRLAAFLGLTLIVGGMIAGIDSLIEAATYDGPPVFGGSGGPTFTDPFLQDRADLLVNALKGAITAGIGFALMRINLSEADKRS